jgi:hypothetical protein
MLSAPQKHNYVFFSFGDSALRAYGLLSIFVTARGKALLLLSFDMHGKTLQLTVVKAFSL